ncbi:MAG: YbdK family carboxylate-amine ligase, partial [Actinomycetota bacterium]|nr:YbdK family carboxylate-amine ligase [Actinomycetota bacterium]
VKTELFASVCELATEPCADADEAGAALGALRQAAREAAAAHGLVVAAAGSHPFADPEAQPVVQEPRYTDFVDYAGVSARRQGVQGLHVHVAMPGPDECYAALEAILPWLPLVLALSANSPYLAGRATGMASNRALVLAELPRSGGPPAFGSYRGWEDWVERLVSIGVTADYTRIWWDVRPHPRLGTLEIRMPDQPTSLARSTAFVALVRELCRWALQRGPSEVNPADRGDYAQNRWAAARFGPRAELVHPDGERAVHVAELWAELRETLADVAALDALDAAGCEADLQLALDPRAAAADLVTRTFA